MEKITIFHGKLTISTGPFSIAMLNYQRVLFGILGIESERYDDNKQEYWDHVGIRMFDHGIIILPIDKTIFLSQRCWDNYYGIVMMVTIILRIMD